MRKSDPIKHKGIIQAIRPGKIEVEVIVESACGDCHARKACALAETDNRSIEIALPEGRCRNYGIGETVNVLLKPSQARAALFYGYLLPLVLFLTALFFFTVTLQDELRAGLSALAMLFPYYGILFMLQRPIRKMFSFDIEKWTPQL